MSRVNFRRFRWRSLRWVSLFLISLFAVVSLISPVSAQWVDEGDFCEINPDTIEDISQGRSYGDPHINTYDGLHYSFQTVGEFLLTKSEDGSFEVQARQQPVGDRRTLSLNTAVAMNVCGHRVVIYSQDTPDGSENQLWLDGEPLLSDESAWLIPNGGEIQRESNGHAVIWPSGDQVLVRFISVGGNSFINIMPTLSDEHEGEMIGLLGNFDGDNDDDLMTRNGRVIPSQSTYSIATNTLDNLLPSVIPVQQVENAYFNELYREFGDSWRISQAESLFDYAPGESTETFSDRSFPDRFFTLNGLTPVQLRTAVTTCREAGVDDALMDGCVFDVAATGNASFAESALNAVGNAVVRELRDRLLDEIQDIIPIPRLPF